MSPGERDPRQSPSSSVGPLHHAQQRRVKTAVWATIRLCTIILANLPAPSALTAPAFLATHDGLRLRGWGRGVPAPRAGQAPRPWRLGAKHEHSDDPPPPPPRFLVLFKGGAAWREDSGHSLSGFRQAEFRAIADMYGVNGSGLVFRDALVTDLAMAAGLPSRAAASSSGRGEVVDEEDEEEEGEEGHDASSLQHIEGPSAADMTSALLRDIVSRLVLTQAGYEVWAVGDSWASCAAAACQLQDDDPRLQPLTQGRLSWSFTWTVFGCKRGRRRSLTGLPAKLELFRDLLLRLPGRVVLQGPQAPLVLLQDGDEAEGETLHRVYLAREVGRGPRGLVLGLSLKTRSYVSTTSMDARVSLVMANVAQVSAGSRVLDPFAGSAGLLLAAAKLGAGVTVGVDVNSSIDLSRVWGNFHQQRLTPPAAYLFGDAATAEVQSGLWEWGPFDAVISDPPYGKREKGSLGAEGAADEAAWTLVGMAADSRLLKVGGRLVFFVPCHPRVSSVSGLLPRHACLALTDTSCQRLNANLNRWLVTMTKVREAAEGEEVLPPLLDQGAWGDDEEGEGGLKMWHYQGRRTAGE